MRIDFPRVLFYLCRNYPDKPHLKQDSDIALAIYSNFNFMNQIIMWSHLSFRYSVIKL